MYKAVLANNPAKTVKLTLTSSVHHLAAISLVSRYARRLTPMRPNRPHIPSITNQVQRAVFRQKTCDPPIPWRIPSRLVFRFSEPSLPFPSASVRHRHVSASVRRYLRMGRGTRKSKKRLRCKNFAVIRKHRKIWWLAQEWPQRTRRCGNFLATAAPLAAGSGRGRAPDPAPWYQPDGKQT